MANHNVAFLDAGGVGGGDVEEDVGEILHLAAGLAGHGDDFHAQFLSHLEGVEDVFGVAGGGDAHDDIASLGGAAQEPREDEVIAVVVAHGGEVGGVAMQGLGVERRPVEVETAGEFRGEVLGIRRATAVAAEVDFAAIAQGRGNHVRGLLDAVEELGVIQYRLFRGDGLGDGLGNSGVHFWLRV